MLCMSFSTGMTYAAEATDHEMDVGRWNGGRWVHADHLGRVGWWWMVGDGWGADSPVMSIQAEERRKLG